MPIQFDCPACGRSVIAPDTAAGVTGPCPLCKARITAPVPSETPGSAAQGAFTCPRCGSTQVQKVSAIVRGGSWSGTVEGAAITYGHTSDGHGVSGITPYFGSTSGRSALARALSPPPRPCHSPWPHALAWGALALAAALGLFADGLPADERLVLWVLCVGFAALFAVLLPVGVFLQQQAKRALPRWADTMQRWSGLFYCARCDTVYDPRTGRVASPDGISALLHSP